MIKYEWPLDRLTMKLFRNRLDTSPFKEGNEVIFRYLKKIMPVSRLSQPCHQPHPKQVPPEQDGLVHIPCCHGKVIYTIKFYHNSPPHIVFLKNYCQYPIIPMCDILITRVLIPKIICTISGKWS